MSSVTITDVYLRDGLQDEDVVVPTELKVRIAGLLADAGVPAIEAASFVNPSKVPQMADADALLAGLADKGLLERAVVSGLAVNDRGIDRAIAAGTPVISIVTSASEAHSRANAGRSIDEALDSLESAVRHHPGVRFLAGVSTAFTCPFEGDIPTKRLAHVVDRFIAMGITDIGLADTLGTTPTERVLSALATVIDANQHADLSLHLHDAHGQALATALAAIQLGVTRFDAALAGYGGCPFAPGAHGNLATEHLVRTLHMAGHSTGIDEAALAIAAAAARAAVEQSPRLQATGSRQRHSNAEKRTGQP
ncbi:hydroxymethylglutaryl-CoA lyase [Agromyces sp. NPDC058484]|uniref:hydroxymethylglutaryl-CoA lyase n=1 Tax=Agromyces sp. NPDC058484 TaxID=3346524 RepID=UPI00366A0499